MYIPVDDDSFRQFCAQLGCPDLTTDARFATAASRQAMLEELDRVLDKQVSARSIDEWSEALHGSDIVWDPVQTVHQLVEDPQFVANEYLVPVHRPDGSTTRVVASPVQFDEEAPTVRPGPTELGEGTDQELLSLGYTWDEIIELKLSGSVL
jgi:crotonobetainyl-CoA:carnitine CoA-transferase CaiB-like acyl-CoA transferase